MTDLEKKVLNTIKENVGIKTSEIASLIDCDRITINSILNGTLRDYCYQDTLYRWYYDSGDIPISTIKETSVDEKISNICKYYLNCLSLENINSISAYISSNTKEYIFVDDVTSACFCDENVSTFVRNISTNRNATAYLGYPIELFEVYSPKQNKYFRKIMPVFLFPIEYNAGNISLMFSPIINTEIVKKYSNQNVNSIIYDVIALEEELGLNNLKYDFDIEDLVYRLQSIRNWAWKEEINPSSISNSKFSEYESEVGIYNKSIIISSERSQYTIGLESELKLISEFDESRFAGTALYKWVHSLCSEKEVKSEDEKILIEVLPLNSEQEIAVQKALSSDLTVVTGPPGTGKSQVVTDLIVNAAWQGKTVLFASKNNKAVDIVEQRVNSLAKKPILFRLGHESLAHHFVEIAENMISNKKSEISNTYFEKQKLIYSKIIDDYRATKRKKDDFVNLRNHVDLIEQKYCKIRDLFSNYYFVVSENDINDIDDALKPFIFSFFDTQKDKQRLLIRLIWPIIKNKRMTRLANNILSLNLVLKKYNISIDFSKLSEEYVDNISSLISDLIDNIRITIEYRELQKELKCITPIEETDKLLIEYKHKLAEMARSLWSNWLDIRKMNINSELRNDVSEFIATLKLIGSDNLFDYPQYNERFRDLQTKLSRSLPCWAVTSLSAKGRVPLEAGMFDIVVIDEASQCDIASIIPLLYRAKTAVIIGDSKQLSHICAISNKQDFRLLEKYDIRKDWSYVCNSLYDKALGIADVNNIINLRDHHRSHMDIINFSNIEFYNGDLRIATNYDVLNIPNGYNYGVSWVDTIGKSIGSNKGGIYNIEEAREIVLQLKKYIVDSEFLGSVGVVTPFRAQADYIKTILEKEPELFSYLYQNNDFWVDTVHKFQGDERDIIFFSPVISDGATSGSITFLKNTGNLFNVAITRARSALVIVGNMNFCSTCGVLYLEHFVEYVNNLKIKQVSNAKVFIDLGRKYPPVQNEEQVSEWEKIFYTALYDIGIKTVPQYPVDKYKLDLAIIDDNRMLDIEIDGEEYHCDWNGELCYRDQLRNQRLYEIGWDVKRFWVYQIRDELPWCVEQIKEWIEQEL